MNNGWIKLYRKFLDSPLWKYAAKNNYPELVHFWISLLLMVNYEDKKWYDGQNEIIIKKGSIVTSYSELSFKIGLTNQTIRTCIKHCENMKMLTRTSTNKYTQLSIVNWIKYQPELTSNLTIDQQTTNKRLTTTKEVKNIRSKEYTYNKNSYPQSGSEYDKNAAKRELAGLQKFRSSELIRIGE